MNITALIGAIAALLTALGTIIAIIRHATGPKHVTPPATQKEPGQ